MSLDLQRVRAICFDNDGTLCDTDDQYVQKLAGWLRPGRLLLPRRDPLPVARWLVMKTETPGTFLFGLPDRLGVDAPLAKMAGRVRSRGKGKPERTFLLMDGVPELLTRLAQRFPLALVSARDQRGTQTFLQQTGLGPLFCCTATAQTCRYTKPYPDPILWAAEKMGVSPNACLMVGDTTIDIRAGKAAGAQTAGVLCGFGEENELRRAGADIILSKTTDLLSLFIT